MDSGLQPSRRPTMGDVAARAGVSLKTVSRVVNGEDHVRPELADRVRGAITDLGYRPDRRARQLAATSPSGRLIGYVQVDAANPFFAAVYRGLEDVTRETGLLIIAGSTDADPLREASLVETLVELRVDGLVMAGAEGSDQLLVDEVERGTPVVCVDRLLPGVDVDTVVSSNRDSTRDAVIHLRTVGHHRIAFLGGDPRVWTVQERRAGYRDALATTGLEPGSGLEIVDVGDPDRAAQATRDLLAGAHPPTAIFAAQDRITTGVVAALHDLDRHHDVALFGFDEIPLGEQLSPTVSVVAQNPYEMGRRAGMLLLNRLSGERGDTTRSVLDAPLRHRQSGDIPPQGR